MKIILAGTTALVLIGATGVGAQGLSTAERWNEQARILELQRRAEQGLDPNGGFEATTRGVRVSTGNRTGGDIEVEVTGVEEREARPVQTTAARPSASAADAEPFDFPREYDVDLKVTFETGSAFIRPEGARLLSGLCQPMRDAPASWTFNVIGHADAAGGAALNQRLSLLRAREVKRHLARECDVDEGRLRAVGLGETRLLAGVPAVSEENRRVEVSLNSI